MPDAVPNILDNYRAAASANPTSAEAQSNLGWGYYGQHLYEDAIKAFQAALALDSNYVDGNYGLALALKESGAGAKAVPVFETVIKLTSQMENSVRGVMLARLARGHVNQIQSGNWHLTEDPHPVIG